MRIRQISWSEASHIRDIVNARCKLRKSVEKKSFIHTKDRTTCRTYVMENDSGEYVAGVTLRRNAWYLSEFKYVYGSAEDIKVLLKHVIELGVRCYAQVTVGVGELALRKALKALKFSKHGSLKYKGSKAELWGRSVEWKQDTSQDENVLLDTNVPVTPILTAGVRKKVTQKTAPQLTAPHQNQYPDEEFRGTKQHRHSGLGWHAIKTNHAS